jgi:hypothetical protein
MRHIGMHPELGDLSSDECAPSAEKYLLGLCEGNFCSGGRHGRKEGNGQIVRFSHCASCCLLTIMMCAMCLLKLDGYTSSLTPCITSLQVLSKYYKNDEKCG